jgi:hypothetical protein
VTRPDFSTALNLILRDIEARVPELEHLRAERILITCGQARKKSRATTRPFSFAETKTRRSETGKLYKPIVVVGGKRIRYEITLRPLFFLRSTPKQRLKTLFHELYHISPAFDGTLAEERRHERLPRAAFDAEIGPLLRRYEKQAPAWVMETLSHSGEVMVLQWLERPPHRYRPSQTVKRRYSARDLFFGPVIMA